MRKVFAVLVFIAALAIPASAQGHSVVLTWTASADAATNPTLTYNVYKANAPCSAAATFTKVNSAPITVTTFTDGPIPPGSYCYEATAVLNGVESVFSNQAPAVVLPAPPTVLTAKPQ